MTHDKVGIAKTVDDKDGNEQFYILQFDPSRQATQSGYIKERQGPLSEAVIRDFFTTFGRPALEVDEMLRIARATYRP